MLQARKQPLDIIPVAVEPMFVNAVLASYENYELTQGALMVTEMDVLEILMDSAADDGVTYEIFEDNVFLNHIKKQSKLFYMLEEIVEDYTDQVISDIIVTLDNHNLCFYHDTYGVLHNMYTKEVW
ncbi:hypothetical protein AAXE64_27370 [Priestia megaterium]